MAEIFGGLGMCLWCRWKDLDEQDLIEFFRVRFGIQNMEILICKWFLPLKKTRFWKGKISWGRGNTWADGTGHTSTGLISGLYLPTFKPNITHFRTKSSFWFLMAGTGIVINLRFGTGSKTLGACKLGTLHRIRTGTDPPHSVLTILEEPDS